MILYPVIKIVSIHLQELHNMFKSQFQRKILAHAHCQLWDKNFKEKTGDNNKNKY